MNPLRIRTSRRTVGLVMTCLAAIPLTGACGTSTSDQPVAGSTATRTYTPYVAPSPSYSPEPEPDYDRAARLLCKGGAVKFGDAAARKAFAREKFSSTSYVRTAFGTTSIAEFVDDEPLFIAADALCRPKWKPLARWWYDNHPTTPGALALTIGIGAEEEPSIGTGPQYDVNLAYRDWTREDCERMASAMADGYVEADDQGYAAVQQCYDTAEYYGN